MGSSKGCYSVLELGVVGIYFICREWSYFQNLDEMLFDKELWFVQGVLVSVKLFVKEWVSRIQSKILCFFYFVIFCGFLLVYLKQKLKDNKVY